jgi:hypothetical protein
MTMQNQNAYQSWNQVVQILDAALDQGVPKQYYPSVAVALRGAEDEMTAIENAQLQTSQAQYTPIFQHLDAIKTDLQNVANNAAQIIAAANQAGQLIQMLTALLPLIP